MEQIYKPKLFKSIYLKKRVVLTAGRCGFAKNKLY